MDIIHHTLIGGIGCMVITGSNQEAAGLAAGSAFLAGSILPDFDVFMMAFGKRFYLKNHQGPTHSLLLSPLLALLIALPAIWLFMLEWSWFIFLASILGLWLHSSLDVVNTFGISLFWPLSKKRYSFDAIFFVDVVTWILTLSLYLFSHFYDSVVIFIAYLSVFTLYISFKFHLQRKVKAHLNCEYAIPSSCNPFEFFILETEDYSVKTYEYHAWNRTTGSVKYYDYASDDHIRLAKTSKVFTDMSSITKFFHITDVIDENQGTTIMARDLAVRNFGGKFGKTTLRFNKLGELVHEVANI